MKKYIFIAFLFIIVPLSAVVYTSNAKSACSSINDPNIDQTPDLLDKCQQEIDSLKSKATSYQNALDYIDAQMTLTQQRIQNSLAKIAKTTDDISRLGSNIDDIKGRMIKLEASIAYQQQILDARMRVRYKIQESSPVIVLFGSATINQIVQRAVYLQDMELQDTRKLDEMDKTKIAYSKQKGIFEDQKSQSEQLKADLVQEKANLDSYKNDLASQKEEKQSLLAATQAGLDKAEQQLASFKSFVQSAGGGTIPPNGFGKGSEGWYLSQRDSRWAGYSIGRSSDNIFEVGCLVTSVAMIYNYYGVSATPASIAADNKRYLYPTADMLIPWVGPKGRTYHAITRAQIDTEISDNPVIVGIYAGAFGTHFVVLSKKSGSDYIMYDPYYGPDLMFSSRYSKSSIFQAVVFK